MEASPRVGKITVAPEVLGTIARMTALAVPGVARLVSPPGVQRLLRQNGVKLEMVGDSVCVDLYVVAGVGVNMLGLGREIQTEVTRAMRDMAGMQVAFVNVHIEDVTYSSEVGQQRV